jgi:hypothetical protein
MVSLIYKTPVAHVITVIILDFYLQNNYIREPFEL